MTTAVISTVQASRRAGFDGPLEAREHAFRQLPAGRQAEMAQMGRRAKEPSILDRAARSRSWKVRVIAAESALTPRNTLELLALNKHYEVSTAAADTLREMDEAAA